MARLLLITLMVAAIRTKVASGFQSTAMFSCAGKPAALYNFLTAPYLLKASQATSANDYTDTCVAPAPPPCACASYPPLYTLPLPPVAARTVQLLNAVGSRVGMAGVPSLTGIVVSSPGLLQQTGPATILQVPRAITLPLDSPAHDPPTDPTLTSHIMTIPNKASLDDSPTVTYSTAPTTESCPSPNSIYPEAPPNFPSRPLYYTQHASIITSCPATVFYPTSQPVPYAQSPVVTYSVLQSPPTRTGPLSTPPKSVYTPSSTLISSVSNESASAAVVPSTSTSFPSAAAASSASTSPSSLVKDPLLTFKLLAASKKARPPASTLEAENKDCSMPIPPNLV